MNEKTMMILPVLGAMLMSACTTTNSFPTTNLGEMSAKLSDGSIQKAKAIKIDWKDKIPTGINRLIILPGRQIAILVRPDGSTVGVYCRDEDGNYYDEYPCD